MDALKCLRVQNTWVAVLPCVAGVLQEALYFVLIPYWYLFAERNVFLIVSVALHILIPSQIRTFETSAVTAATVPTLLIRGMILCSVILLVQGILSKEKTEYTISGAIFTKENLLRLKPIIYIAMLIAYALLLPHIGFIISSLLLANGILLYFGTRKWWFYAIASANVIVAYFAFQAMSVTLP